MVSQRMWSEHELKDRYDVVIIGGGVHGLATAYYLTQMGVRNIAVLEARYIGFGGSGRNTAIVRSNYRTPEGIAFYDLSVKLYEQLANVEDAETDLQLSGIAGEAVVYHRYLQNEQDRQVLEWLDQQVIERLIRLRNETNLDGRISGFLAKEVRQLIEEYSQREDN